MLNTSINIKTDKFDGPLALLLLLIKKEEMSVKDFDIRIITKQYLQYIEHFKELNFNLAGDFLLMAAILVYLKSKDCIAVPLPGELEAEIDILSTEELTRRLEALEQFQKLGLALNCLPCLGRDFFCNIQKMEKNILTSGDLEISKIVNAYLDVLSRQKQPFAVITKEKVSIKSKLIQLKEYLEVGMQLTFDDLYPKNEENYLPEKVISFISVLELARLKKIEVFQNENFSPIHINVLAPISEADVGIIVEDYL